MTATFQFLLMLGITYYFVAILQTVFHRLFGHTKRIHAVFETHAMGHHRVYRPDDLLSDEWKLSGSHVIWYYAFPISPFFIALWWYFPVAVGAGFTLGLAGSIGWHIYLHRQYHIRGCFWERFHWFLYKRELHFIHHRRVNTNYAIAEYWLDDLMGTKQEPLEVSHSTT